MSLNHKVKLKAKIKLKDTGEVVIAKPDGFVWILPDGRKVNRSQAKVIKRLGVV